jgi:hypothetical protein
MKKRKPMGFRFLLQRIVFLVVFGKIQSLRLGRDTLAGVVPELEALFVRSSHALFGAEDLLIIEFRAEAAVGAGFLDALSKEHGFASCFCLMP